jgi:hypothetical protein
MRLVAALLVMGSVGVVRTEAEACSPAPPCPVYSATPPMVDPVTGGPMDPIDGEVAPEPVQKSLDAARADDLTKLKALGTSLRNPEFLKLLGTDAQAARCVVGPILASLARNPHARARTEFLSLLKAKAWKERPEDVDGSELHRALLGATAQLAKPPAQVVSFWKAHAKPDDGWVNVTTMVLVENGSPAALKLFAQLVVNKSHDLDTRVGWLQVDYAPQRHRPAVMAMATKLLAGKLPQNLREAIIDASIGPSHVRSTCAVSVPPVNRYNQEMRTGLRALIAAARKGTVDESHMLVLENAVAELDKRDQMPVLDD